MIKEADIRRELQDQFGYSEQSKGLSYDKFADYLKTLNADHPFDEDLTNQLFEKMCSEMQTNSPTLEIFPKVYIDAFEFLDKKIDIEDEHIRVLNLNIDENEQLLDQLKYQFQMNILPEKKQVTLGFSIEIQRGLKRLTPGRDIGPCRTRLWTRCD